MDLLLDTSVLIDALRARNQRRELLADLLRAGHTLSTTALNIAELYAGMRSSERTDTEAMLVGLQTYELDASCARLAGKLKADWLKKGRTLALIDTIIAAIGITHGCVLVTDNRKDFPMTELELYPLP